MDDFVGTIAFVLLIAGIGWLLGIVGYFRANRAIAELRQLRAVLAAQGAPPAERAVWTAPIDHDVAAPEAAAAAQPVQDEPFAPPPPRRDWEELLTAKWGVWLGAAALLLSGVFLVRYAADEGLLGPPVRCGVAVLLAVALIAAAEWLRRRSAGPARLPDYAPGALAAGGVAVLFAAAYLAGPLYNMVDGLVAFALLAAASLAGLALSLRMGQLVAAVGLVGAFVTPLLVQTGAPSLPGLFSYLLFAAAAALAVMRYTAWVWLGWATMVAGAGFVLLIIVVTGAEADLWAPALFLPAVALLALWLLPGAALDHRLGRRLAYLPVAALASAGLLLSFAMPDAAVTQAGVLLLVALTVAKAATEPRLDRLSWLGAAVFLVLVAGWGLPPWRPTGEAITAGGSVIAVLPGAWAPAALRPLLLTAAIVAALFFAAGLWGERRRPNPLRWSALAAAVPVLAVAILYARVAAFQPDDLWAAAALGVAVLGTLAASAARREGDGARAGAHAAGATAALALGCACVLTAQWLTVGLALFVPALAAIEHKADLPPLRRVALAVAAVAACRLLLNPSVLQEATGQPIVLDGLLPAYGVAAAGFAVASRMFRRRTDDLVVAVLELCSAAFVAALVLLEVRQWATGRQPAALETSFLEIAMDVSALALLSLFAMHLQMRTGRAMLGWAGRVGGCMALAGGVGLLLVNPAFDSDANAGGGVVLNALLPAYAIPAAVIGVGLWMRAAPPGSRNSLRGYALVAAFGYVTLAVRHAFHPDHMALSDAPIEDAELWAWSGAWLMIGLVLMAIGILTREKALRLTALALVVLTSAKVFLIDMSGLVGLWRVLSFLGLGLTLIALGVIYRRFVAPSAPGELQPRPSS